MKRNFYEKNTANYPRLKTDKYFSDYDNVYKYDNFIDDTFSFIEKIQLLSPELWQRFVNQFLEHSDSKDAGWRGEYWGKMMRGATFVYSYTKNEDLYIVLKNTVLKMIEAQEESGRISSYTTDCEFDGWDIWSRKYVLLGMQYFLEICKSEKLKKDIIASMCRQVDYIMSKIGKSQDGKREITSATRNWRGLNSSSILEPVVRLYNITGEKEYLDFATYIVESGGIDIENVFELALKDELYPYQYPITKAYEMISCFEGLLEYYRVTGIEKYKQAVILFANKILESDFTVIGSCGCTHELFDHSTVRQANTTNGSIAQETCVTVTLMKFFYQLTLLTGDVKYIDAFEVSFYNAYLGSVNTEKCINSSVKGDPDLNKEPLPFDSYSPLTSGTRGRDIGGFRVMTDNHYYGCCACIGAVGIGLVPKIQVLSKENGLVVNLYISGMVTTKTPDGKKLNLKFITDYPKTEAVKIEIECESEEFEISFRNPHWSENTTYKLNGIYKQINEGYINYKKIWQTGDIIELKFDMRTKAIYPISYGSQILMNKVVLGHSFVVPNFDREDENAKKHIALRRGPVMLAQENRLGYSVDDAISVKVSEDGYVECALSEEKKAPYNNIIEIEIPLENGKKMTVTDYASAGKLWGEESKMAVWMLTNK